MVEFVGAPFPHLQGIVSLRHRNCTRTRKEMTRDETMVEQLSWAARYPDRWMDHWTNKSSSGLEFHRCTELDKGRMYI